MKINAQIGVKGGKNWLKRWWEAPSDRKLLITTWAAIAICLVMVGIRPAWNWIGHAGRDVPWADILTRSAAAASTPGSSAPSGPPTAPTSASAGSAGTLAPAAPATAPLAQDVVAPSGPSAAAAPTTTPTALPAMQATSPASKTEAVLFGDQLQALSSLYEALITVLAVGLGLLAAIGFAAIRFASMREAESMARLVFNGPEHRAFVAAEIAKAVEAQWKEIASNFNDLQDRVDVLEQSDETVETPQQVKLPAEQAVSTSTPMPTPQVQPQPSTTSLDTLKENQADPSAVAEPQPTPTPTPLPVPPVPPANAGALESAETGEVTADPEPELTPLPDAIPDVVVEPNTTESDELRTAPKPSDKPEAGD